MPDALLPPQLLARLESLDLISRKIFLGRFKGERRSARKGRSVEFADYRNYAQGDDLRFVDWNLYARLDRLFVKLFLEEEDLHVYVLLDAGPSMDFGEPTKFRVAQQTAAALAFIGLIRSHRVRIETLGQNLRTPGPTWRGRHNAGRMFAHLESLEPTEKTSLVEGVRNFGLRNSGRGVLVLVTDLMDKQGYDDALRYLTARRMDTYVVHVLSQEELRPDLQGDLRLVDCEDGDAIEVTVGDPLLRAYDRTLKSFLAEAREFCGRRGLNYLFVDNGVSVERVVVDLLRRQGLVK
jgi:uncharacterized protein (DUF58 family)